METINTSSTIISNPFVIGLCFVICAYIFYKIFSIFNNKKPIVDVPSSTNSSQDFSTFESSPDKFSSSLEDDSEKNVETTEEYTIKGDMSRLTEFLDKLISLPRDTLDYITISKIDNDDMLVCVQFDEDKGLYLEALYPLDCKTDYSTWLSSMQSIVQEMNLQADEIDPKYEEIDITLEGKSSHECKEIIDRILKDIDVKPENTLLVEFCHF
jgi:hypothetical protein